MLTSVRGLVAASLLVGCGLAATPALADEAEAPESDITLSGNVVLVTDYRWRGLSYSAGDMAVQGQINVAHSSGLYAGVWASSLEQDAFDIYGSLEADFYAGWSGEVASGLTADAGLTYYVYPNGTVGDGNYFEPYVSLTKAVGPASIKAGVNYAWKQDALGGEDNLYLFSDLNVGVPDTALSFQGHIGYTDGALSPKFLTSVAQAVIEDDESLITTAGGWDYSVGATYGITSNLSVGVSYIGVDGYSFDGFSNDTVVGTLKFAF